MSLIKASYPFKVYEAKLSDSSDVFTGEFKVVNSKFFQTCKRIGNPLPGVNCMMEDENGSIFRSVGRLHQDYFIKYLE